jgi:hypothetical protein
MPPTQAEGVEALERVSGHYEYPDTFDDRIAADELAQTEPGLPEWARSRWCEDYVVEEDDGNGGIDVVFGDDESTYLRIACLREAVISWAKSEKK